jgi:hypothetical protein
MLERCSFRRAPPIRESTMHRQSSDIFTRFGASTRTGGLAKGPGEGVV